MISEKALRAAAKEMNEVMDGLDPALNVKAKLETLTEQMKEAVKFIDPDEDEFTKGTQAVINELTEDAEDADDEEEEAPPKKSKKTKKPPVEEEEDEEEEDEEEDEEDDDDEEEEEAPPKKAKKTKKPPVEEEEDDDDEEDEEDEAPKKKAKKTAKKGGIKKAGGEGQPGIIQTIVSLVEKAGKKGISKKEILEQLKEDFPERNEQSMKNTVNVQVPARINKEKFPVKKVGDDRYTKA